MQRPKQVIVVRSDIKLSKGKLAVQVAHACVKAIMDAAYRSTAGPDRFGLNHTLLLYGFTAESPIIQWLNDDHYAKVCVTVETEKDLNFVYENAKEAGLPCSIITDWGKTEFDGIPTKTCVAVGPDFPHRIDPITGHLPLL